MAGLADFRAKYPGAYDDLSDQELGDRLYSKFYTDMPREEYDRRMGISAAPAAAAAPAPPAPPQVLAKGDRLDRPTTQPHELQSLGRGFVSGALAEWDDEAAAALGIKPFEGDWGRQYANNLERARNAKQAEREAHPEWFTGGQIGGGIASAVAVPLAAPATIPARIALATAEGAAYGGANAAGAADGSAAERLAAVPSGAAWGSLGGAGGGAATTVIPRLAAMGWRAATAPVRGLAAPQREAALRVGRGTLADDAINQPRLTPADEAAAAAAGQPILNVDRGGEATRAVARSAANTSPQARATLETAFADRFASQGSRTGDAVTGIVGGRTSLAAREQLQSAARVANGTAYRAAYAAGDRPVISPELERLMGSPDVVSAMEAAARTGKSRAIADGQGAFNTAVTVTPDGRVLFRGGKSGVPTYPNIQFWDYTYRGLRDAATAAARAGKNDEASYLGQLSRQLRDELDNIVPEYGNARAGAARFFGAGDALEAGDQFVRSRLNNDEARAALARMSQPERELFAEGFADAMTREVREVRDRRNVIDLAFIRSPASRERIELALGPQRARELETYLRVEDYIDRARKALGNSSTARQWVELGLASGAGTIATGGVPNLGDPKFWLFAALTRTGRAGMHAIDNRVAAQVAQLLTSDNPQLIQQGVRMASNNEAIFNALRQLDAPAAVMGAQGNAQYAKPKSVVLTQPQ